MLGRWRTRLGGFVAKYNVHFTQERGPNRLPVQPALTALV